MGCSQSKIENEEAVSRCKDRKIFMKNAVLARNAFAAAQTTYAMALKNAGAALSDFAHGEVSYSAGAGNSISSSSSAPPDLPLSTPQPPPNLPPPPPPIPDFPPTPLQRAVSMPEFVVSKRGVERGFSAEEAIAEEVEDEEEDEEEEEEGFRRERGRMGNSHSHAMEEEEERDEFHGGRGKMGNSHSVEEEEEFRRRGRMGNSHSHGVEAERGRNETTPPPPPMASSNPWDYFFDVEVPGGSLDDVEEVRRERTMPHVMRMVATPTASETFVVEEESLHVAAMQGGRVLKKGKQVTGSGVVSASGSGGGGKRGNVSVVAVFVELDECFLKAYESAYEVSKLLEAARLHYHSNFADNRGHIDHSARLMRVITWNRSFRGLPNTEEFKDDFDSEENETHATVLDKLLAWEKKLYDEVKAGEMMKFDYQKKVALLNKQKKRGTNPESLEKTKAAVSHLHTRYIVDMQSMDSTVSEISHLRDDQLYPKLVALVDAMARMWDIMRGYHEKQLMISTALRSVDISQSAKETTDEHHERTIQLWAVVQEWHTQFDKMVSHQKDYIRSLNSWLKLNLIPIESSLKEKVSSPPRAQNPPIQTLLLAWHDLLDKLPDEHAKSAIYNFAAVLHTIVQQQDDELMAKAKMEGSRRNLERKQRQYNKWLSEYLNKKTVSDETVPNLFEDGIQKDELMVEREFVMETAKRQLEEHTETWERFCIQVREKSLTNLKTRLPELFRALSDFAIASSEMYNNLKSISHSQSQKHKETIA